MPTDVIMPALEMAQETGKVWKWLKAPGHAVRKGEPIVEIETDKVTVEIEAPASGVLRDVTARAGDVVPVGKTIALIFAPGEAGAAGPAAPVGPAPGGAPDRAGPHLNAGHPAISDAVSCVEKKPLGTPRRKRPRLNSRHAPLPHGVPWL